MSPTGPPLREYLDGVLLERNAGEWDRHRLQTLLSDYFLNREKQWGIVVVTEQRVQVRATRFRVPYISILISPAFGEPVVRTAPFLRIEILSPSDQMGAMQERVDDYLESGVHCVALIHPITRRAFVYTADQVREVKDGVLRTENPDICVPLCELE